jgi:hypothetical protein
MPKVMTATRDGVCLKCLAAIEEGEQISYAKEFGAMHVSCPEDPVVEPFSGFVNIAADRSEQDWAIRVISPDGALGREGQEVEIITQRGNSRLEVLGEMVQAFEERHAIYRKAEVKREVTVTEPGVYELPDGTVYVVKFNKAQTSLYAKKLVEINAERATEAGEPVRIEFEYERGAIFKISPEDKMDLERAKKLTIRYGRCIVCGRKLKAKVSVEQGIGPVCIKSFRR